MINKYYVYAYLDPRKKSSYSYVGGKYLFEFEPFYIELFCRPRGIKTGSFHCAINKGKFHKGYLGFKFPKEEIV